MSTYATILKEEREKGKLEGKLEGRLEGRLEGKLEGKIEMIYALYDLGIDLAQLAIAAQLTEEEVKKILNERGE